MNAHAIRRLAVLLAFAISPSLTFGQTSTPESSPAAPSLLERDTPPTWAEELRARPLSERWIDDCWWNVKTDCQIGLFKIGMDFRENYTGGALVELGLALAIAAPLANTHADQSIQNCYQNHFRSQTADNTAHAAYYLGQYKFMVPLMVGVWGAGNHFDDTCAGSELATWSGRTLRGYLIGAPEVGLLQYGLGGSRPGEAGGSRWIPFHDNNTASGHAFIGAVPFLTAAHMTDEPLAKAGFFCASFLAAWSRIHKNAHYTSQAFLGWSIAYIASQSVAQTDAEYRRFLLQPVDLPGGTGLGVMFRY